MARLLTILIALHWAAVLAFAGTRAVESAATAGAWEVVAIGIVAGLNFLASLAFFWTMITVSIDADTVRAGQGDVARFAVAAGLVATTVSLIQPALAGQVAALQLMALQFAGLLVSHLIMQGERPAIRQPVGDNDNSRAAARLLAVLASSDARINRMTQSGGAGRRDLGR